MWPKTGLWATQREGEETEEKEEEEKEDGAGEKDDADWRCPSVGCTCVCDASTWRMPRDPAAT